MNSTTLRELSDDHPDTYGRMRLLRTDGGLMVREGRSGPDRHDAPGTLRNRVHQAIRARHTSPRTEKTYWLWIHRFLQLQGMPQPIETGEACSVPGFFSPPVHVQPFSTARTVAVQAVPGHVSRVVLHVLASESGA